MDKKPSADDDDSKQPVILLSQSQTDEVEDETKSQSSTDEIENETTFQSPTDEVEPKGEDVVNAKTQPEANDNDNTSDLQTVHTSTPQAEECFLFRFFIFYINILFYNVEC
jgi:hypothetical protein